MSSPDDGTVRIRGYHLCFRLERRLHKLDRWRIPVPYGVPLRGVAYAAVVLLAMLLLAPLPVVGDLLGLFSPWLRYVVLPVGAAWALHSWTIDGRPAPRTAAAWLRWRIGPSRITAFRSAPPIGPVSLGDVTVAPDGASASLRKGVVEGPARVILRYPVSVAARGSTLRVSQTSEAPQWRGKQVQLRRGQRLVIG